MCLRPVLFWPPSAVPWFIIAKCHFPRSGSWTRMIYQNNLGDCSKWGFPDATCSLWSENDWGWDPRIGDFAIFRRVVSSLKLGSLGSKPFVPLSSSCPHHLKLGWTLLSYTEIFWSIFSLLKKPKDQNLLFNTLRPCNPVIGEVIGLFCRK